MVQLPGERHITYQLRYWQCADPTCQICRLGLGHGPDWYAFWYKDGELYSLYIGPADPISFAPPMEPSASEGTAEIGSGSVVDGAYLEEGPNRE